MRLGDQSAKALTWFAAILLVFGQMAMHPTARFGIAICVAVMAVVVIIFGRPGYRIFAGVVFLLALLIAVPAYSEHRKLHDSYLERARSRERSKPEIIIPKKADSPNATAH